MPAGTMAEVAGIMYLVLCPRASTAIIGIPMADITIHGSPAYVPYSCSEFGTIVVTTTGAMLITVAIVIASAALRLTKLTLVATAKPAALSSF